MSMPSGKKILLISFVIVLLVAIPITIFWLSRQKTQTSAIPATGLSLSPSAQSANVGDSVNFDISIDPGTNQVSFVKVLISYDATKLATEGAGFVPNSSAFPSLVQSPTYGPGTISVTVSIGASGPPVETPTTVGTLTFKTLASTDTAPTQITFGNQTQVLSLGASDQFNENVLSTTTPATVNIAAVLSPTPTEIPLVIESPTPTPVLESDASVASGGGEITSPPTCLSFTADRALTGTVPYNVNFTFVGSSSATIVKATFNFGDGQVKDLTQADGIGPTTLNALTSHIYNIQGTFSAFGTITDENGAVSQVGTCTVILTINPSDISEITPQPSPLPPTGPSAIVTIGIIGILIAAIGLSLFLAL